MPRSRGTMAEAERRYPFRMPKGWNPPVPAWTSTFPETKESVSMCVAGFQHPAGMDMGAPIKALHAALEGADIRDLAMSERGDGLIETVCIAYWLDPDRALELLGSPAFEAFWADHSDPSLGYGLFRESVNIPFDRTETLFSGTEHDHGYSQLRDGHVGPIRHHQYWGGMRDRIPLSGRDLLEPNGPVRLVERSRNHVVVAAHENLCIIRSGQDWSKTEGEQLQEYEEQIEPTLKAGMAFLRDQGAEVDCYSCRYLRDIAVDGEKAPRTSGMAYFRSMKALEDWAAHHPTHLAIFNIFLSIAPKYGPNLQLRLWHEVSVLPAAEQLAVYVNCKADTGLMGGL